MCLMAFHYLYQLYLHICMIFLVYNKYIKINLPDIEITVAEYAVTNSVVILNILNIPAFRPASKKIEIA